MATRRSGRAAIAVAVGVLLTTTLGGTTAVAAPATRSDGVAAVIADYQARIPQLMAREHIPGLALAVVDGDRVVWQQGFGSTGRDGRGPSPCTCPWQWRSWPPVSRRSWWSALSGHWWIRWIRPRDAALAIALTARAAQLGFWHLVGWGF